MAESLYNFMETLNQNNVRTQNLFEMRVFIPSATRNAINTNFGNDLTTFFNPNFTFYGQGFELPERTMQYADVGFKGFTVPVPTVMKMGQEHTVTINADIYGNMRRAFLAWQACTMNPQIDVNGGFFEGNRHLNNSAKIYIMLLDPEFGEKEKHKISDIYAIYGVTVGNVGTMQFSNENSAVATFSVQFRSQYWQNLTRGRSDKDGVVTDLLNNLDPSGGREFTEQM